MSVCMCACWAVRATSSENASRKNEVNNNTYTVKSHKVIRTKRKRSKSEFHNVIMQYEMKFGGEFAAKPKKEKKNT